MVAGLLVLAGVPLLIALLVGLIVALPLSMVLFRGLRGRLDEALAAGAGAAGRRAGGAARAGCAGTAAAGDDRAGRALRRAGRPTQQPEPEPDRGER